MGSSSFFLCLPSGLFVSIYLLSSGLCRSSDSPVSGRPKQHVHGGVPHRYGMSAQSSRLIRRAQTLRAVSVKDTQDDVFNEWATLEITLSLPNDRPLYVNAPVAVCPEAVELNALRFGTSATFLFVAGLTGLRRPAVYTYRVSSVLGETWTPPRPIDFPGMPEKCLRHFAPSVSVSPSKKEVIFFGGPEQCNQVFVWSDHQIREVSVSGFQQAIKYFAHGSILMEDTDNRTLGQPRLLVFGGTSYDEQREQIVQNGTNDVWQLLFSSKELREGVWSKVEATGEDIPPQRISPGWFQDKDSAVLYGGIGFEDDGQSYPLCDAWRLNLTTMSWTRLAAPLHADCSARVECELVMYPDVLNPYSPLVTFLRSAKLLVVFVSGCIPPAYDVWTLNVSLSHGRWQNFQPAEASMQNVAALVLSGTASSLINDGQSVFLTIAQSGTYSGREGRTTYRMLSVRGERLHTSSSESFAFMDVMPVSDQSFVGSLGCHSPPPVFTSLSDGRHCFLLLGGNCPIYSFTQNQAEGIPVMVWTACETPPLDTMRWTKNAFAEGPGYGNRIGHTVLAPGTNRSFISVIFGGISFSQLPFELFIVPNSLWCFDSMQFSWKKAIAGGLLPPARAFHTAVVADDGGFIVYGGLGVTGNGSFTVLNDVWRFVFSNITQCEGRWQNLSGQITPSPLPALYGHTATLYGNHMFIFGGKRQWSEEYASNSFFFLDFKNWSWQKVATSHPLQGRFLHTAVQIGTAMLVLGGCQSGHSLNCTNDTSIYPTSTGTLLSILISHNSSVSAQEFSMEFDRRSDSMPEKLFRHQAALLGDTLYLLGGQQTTQLDIPLWNAVENYIAKVSVGCPKGYFSVQPLSMSDKPCQPCPIGMYSTEAGSRECIPCIGDATTAQVGSGSQDDCRLCKPDLCRGHGSCSLDQTTMEAECNCDTGYWSHDKCFLPVYYIIGVAAVLVAVLLLGMLVSVCRKYRRKVLAENEKTRQLRSSRKEISQLTSAWRIDGSEMTLRHRIDSKSRGAFCEVWLAEYRDMLVAVKRLQRIQLLDADSIREFEREVEIMRTLRHPNVILFLGAGTEPQTGNTFLVIEYLKCGTLRDVLLDAQVNIDHAQRLRFALDAAKGMRFLHGLDPPRIHRDLKSSNLLVSERWVVKVADFGAARLVSRLQESQPIAPVSLHCQPVRNSSTGEMDECTPLLNCESHMSRRVGTLLWQSPEMLSNSPYGASTDIYSFGIVLWEIFCRLDPYHDCPDFHLLPVVCRSVVSGKRPDVPCDCPPSYRQLMEECWTADTSVRPTFAKIVPRLENQLDVCIVE